MGCTGKTTTDMIQIRREICEACDQRDGDTCLIVEQRHPGKSSIKMGTGVLSHECPLKKWVKLKSKCGTCDRMAYTDRQGECVWCVNKRSLAR